MSKIFDYKFLIILGLSLVVYFLYREVEFLNKRVAKLETNTMAIEGPTQGPAQGPKPQMIDLPPPPPDEDDSISSITEEINTNETFQDNKVSSKSSSKSSSKAPPKAPPKALPNGVLQNGVLPKAQKKLLLIISSTELSRKPFISPMILHLILQFLGLLLIIMMKMRNIIQLRKNLVGL